MMEEADNYCGREQTYIKHRFLTRYLQEAAYKIFQGRSRVFNFVDAFAGPWSVADSSNYSDTSFDQALRILHEVRDRLEEMGRTGLRIRFCFCERRQAAAEELRRYAKAKSNFDIRVFHGKFEDHLDGIAAACADGFTFTFIDPTGWNIDSGPIFEFLRERNGEFLLNFMAEHVNRHAGYDRVQASIGRFLASPEWGDDFERLPDEWNNEWRVLQLLRRKMKEARTATHVPHFGILKPGEDRVKMRLLLGTHSARGLELFRDVQWKVEREEMELRERMGQEKFGGSLFSAEEIARLKQGETGVGCAEFQREAQRRISGFLSDHPTATFQNLAIDILDEVPMRMTQTRTLLSEMKSKGIVAYDLPPRKRVPQANTVVKLLDV